MGYYDPYPTLSLDQHFAVTGFLGTEPRRVVRAVCAQTGLNMIDLPRRVEHMQGRACEELLLRVGWSALIRFELEALRGSLGERPGLIALGSRTLNDPECRSLVEQNATLVLLEIDLAAAFWRVRHLQAEGRRVGLEIPTRIERIEELRDLYREHSAATRTADLRISAGYRAPLVVANALRDRLSERHAGSRALDPPPSV